MRDEPRRTAGDPDFIAASKDEKMHTFDKRTGELLWEDRRRKLDILLSLKLSDLQRSTRFLENVIADLSRKARERGLTQDFLDSILDDV